MSTKQPSKVADLAQKQENSIVINAVKEPHYTNLHANEQDLALVRDFEVTNYDEDFALEISSAHALSFDLNTALDIYLNSTVRLSEDKIDEICTATFEAFSNALLWSNLEMPYALRDDIDNFNSLIRERACSLLHGSRKIKVIIKSLGREIMVTVASQGLGFDIESMLNANRPAFKGFEIIKSLASRITHDDEGRILILHFALEDKYNGSKK